MRISLILAFVAITSRVKGATSPETAEAVLDKARAAFQLNHERETHWNWTAMESRELVDKSGRHLQTFVSVTAESIIKSDGKRCNAVIAWGDGRQPYMEGVEADARCQAMENFRPAVQVEALLQSSNIKIVKRSGAEIVLQLLPDKSKLKAADPGVRCAASLRATVRVDAMTYFPRSISGDVVETGCDLVFDPVVQYESAQRPAPMRSIFRKGASFRLAYELQKDRFGRPENSYWICAEQYYSTPWTASARVLYYWGRQFPVTSIIIGHSLIKEIHTTAREFGVESQPRYDR